MKFYTEIRQESKHDNELLIDSIYENYPLMKNILLFGEVQSGKTSIIIKIIDKLFKGKKVDYIFYVTGNTNPLKEQNFNRLRKDLKPLGHKVVNVSDKFLNKKENLEVEKNNVVFTTIKQQMGEFKKYIDTNLSGKKILIIDDEADDYSNSEANAKTLKELLSDNIGLISCTATPFTNLKVSENIYDTFLFMTPWDGYSGRLDFLNNTIPIQDNNLEVNFITLLEFTKIIYSNDLKDGQILFNSDNKTDIHKTDKENIIEIIEEIILYPETAEEEYRKIASNDIDIDKAVKVLKKIKNEGNICELNGTTDHELLNRGLEIVFGGILLSRGITYENLLIEVYRNMGETTTAHTLMQRSRWCGYRGERKDLIKIFAEPKAFKAIDEINELYEFTFNHKINEGLSYKEKVKSLEKTFERIKV